MDRPALSIPSVEYEAMIRYLLSVYPLEGCGLMAGRQECVRRLYHVENILHSPVAYEMEPRQQLEAMLSVEKAGMELLGIYHSHPQGPETPSSNDVARATYPEVAHVIVSLANRRRPVARAFAIVEGQIDEIQMAIV